MRLHESALWLRCASVLAAVALSSASLSGAQQATGGVRSVTAADYEHAEKFLPFNISPHVFHKVHATWLAGDRFWYRDAGPDEIEFVLFDAARGTRQPAFDHARVAAALSAASSQKVRGEAPAIHDLRIFRGRKSQWCMLKQD
jgi:dipeptidyl-peptidase 4